MSERPNVVLVHGHDIGRFLSCHGRASVPSPNLEAFADGAVVFDNAFSTAPLCTPARSSLFTGMSPHVNGLMGLAHDAWRYRHSVRTMPEVLSRYGYDSALVGLQHEHPDPTVLGFGEVRGMGFLPRAWPVAEEAAAWLQDRPADGAPFLLTVGMWEAHRPWRPEDYEFADPTMVDVPAFLPDNEHTREDLAGFHGAIRQFDAAVGHLLRAIDAHPVRANTLVIVTTDHGAALPRAKGTLYDPGVEVALVIRPPAAWGTTPARTTTMVSHLDILPTLVELAGGGPRPEWEGRSLVPDLRGVAPDEERELFFEKTYHDRYDPIRAVRTGRHKLIRNFADGPLLTLAKDLEESPTRRGMGDAHLAPRPALELYDLLADPAERTNLAGEPAYQPVLADLEARLDSWMKATADPLLDGAIDRPAPASRLLDAQPDLPARAG
ncbi:sulfatase [Jiangella aurantiaca]|uniref:Sulfatase n=1 Tax=Jiangella aurantiaca TaxID=2530373 RepID=A0A4R5AF78_9ACTN|nr:sulfatase [Jiangella aurantiaca]TDD71011.1 sulfatase [Jiangella aurantiaca]